MSDLSPSKCEVASWDWGVQFVSEALWEWESQTPRVLLSVFWPRDNTYAFSSIAYPPPPFSPFTQWKNRWDHSLRGDVGPVHSLGAVCVCVGFNTCTNTWSHLFSYWLFSPKHHIKPENKNDNLSFCSFILDDSGCWCITKRVSQIISRNQNKMLKCLTWKNIKQCINAKTFVLTLRTCF